MITAILISFVYLPWAQFAPVALGFASLIALVFAVQNHYAMFRDEYRVMTWTDYAKALAPYIIVGVVILFIIGYLLLLFSSGKPVELAKPPANIPPPNTATNTLTEGVANAIANTGLANVSPNSNTVGPMNNRNLISAPESFMKNLSNTQVQNILRSRAKQAV